MPDIAIKIKTLESSELELVVPHDLPVPDLKQKIHERSQIPPERQRLIFQGKVLKDDKRISDYGIKDGNALHLVAMPVRRQQPQQQRPQQPQQRPQSQRTSFRVHTDLQPHSVLMSTISVPEGGQLPDLNAMISGVLNSMGVSTGNSQQNNVRTNTQSTRRQNLQLTTTDMSFVSNLMDRTLQLMNQNMDGMTRLSNLLKNEQNLSNQQRQEANRLIHQLTPILCTLNTNFSQLAPLISNLQMGTQSGEARTMAVDTRPVLTNLQLHLHTNSNEIDRLNDQLNRVSEIMNQQFNQRPRIIRPGSTSGFGSITVVSEGTVPRGREERMNLGNILSGIMNAPPSQQPFQQSTQQSSQQPSVQGGTQHSLGSIFQTIQETIRDSGQQPTRSLSNIVEDVANRLGIPDTETTQLDSLLKFLLNSLEITDIMSIMSGNWSSLNKIKDPLKKYVTEKYLKNDTSKENRIRIVEKCIDAMEKPLREYPELQNEIKSRVKDDRDPIQECMQVVRTHLRKLFDVIIDGTEGEETFADFLNKMMTILIGEFVDVLSDCCKDGIRDVEKMIYIIFQKIMSSLQQMDQFQFLLTMGSNMAVQFIMNRYRMYKEQYPNRMPTKTPKTILPPPPKSLIQKKMEEKKATEEKKEEKKREEKDEKMEEEIIVPDIDMDEIFKDSKINPIIDDEEKMEESWKVGLSQTEIKEIEDTIKLDEEEMKKMKPEQKFSETYLKGQMSNETGGGKQEEEKESNERGTEIQTQEDLD